MTRFDLDRLDRDRLARLDRVLDAVLELPREARRAELERRCQGDPDLLALAEAILAADDTAGEFLSRPALELMPDLARALEEADSGEAGAEPAGADEAERAGERLGPFRLIREIGRGGMGRVYLADRADGQFEQRVAVKLLKRGIDTDEVLRRFLLERRILARLEHRNIARLVDGGASAEGLPWFALEYVDGTPITEFVDAERLEVPDLLRLFAEAGRAVQFAHRNLVVHRDLKPGNIFVSRRGEVKLLDFGVAKLLGDEGMGGETVGPLRLMTPVYAAPEQVRGEPPTTATDVYALGVILYELLTGERPYRRRTGTVSEIRSAILEEVPDAPSARLRRADPGSRRSRWARAVRGDLDNIVLKAMRKEPEGRYASAEAMVEDIERFLRGEAVQATGRRFAYVARKALKRNRVAVGAAALVLVSLAFGLAATSWQARVAARERDRARLEAKKAGELKDFALNLFQVSDPTREARGDRVTARELLDRGAARVETELKGQPEVQAEMWDLLGGVYLGLGLHADAVTARQKALAAHRSIRPGDHPETAASLAALGQALLENGDYARAEARLREALAMRRRLHGAVSREAADVLSELSVVLSREGRVAEAESLGLRVIEIDSLTVGMSAAATASDLSNLGMLLLYDSRYDEALPHLRRALWIRERALGRSHLETATDIDNVANCLTSMGEQDSTILLHREALAIRRRWLPPGHPDIAHSLANLATSQWRLGEFAPAESLYLEALAIRHRILDPKDPYLGQNHNDLATCYFLHGLRDSAEVHFRTALRIWEGVLPPDHRFVLTTRNNLGVVLRDTGRLEQSEALLRDVWAVRTRTLDGDHLDLSNTAYHLGKLLRMRGRRGEAETLLRRAVEIRARGLGPDHPKVAECQEALATLYRDAGRHRESLALYDAALATCRAKFPGGVPQTAEALMGKGVLLTAMARPADAEPLLREAVAIFEAALRPGDPRIAEARSAWRASRSAQARRAAG